ncbi:Prefoldin subunit 6 [Mycena indigotica]|uniref:Prefoldin subunit 6 n=1 Tax=Mycena indigotica TaxID=2126181 RepID=A0A8H6W9N6_9AGAR|nr:Prefoldin subunit 6 [Mycena indigotica]KAF7306813.1 Prefoldin subunit 6 [Mycena indigotica]
MSLQAKLQSASSDYTKLQMEMSTIVEARQKLDAQYSENQLVDQEFAKLTPDNVVYKQIGPVLVKQEQDDAKKDVKGRLEFISSEIKRVEGQLQDIQTRSDKKKQEVSSFVGLCPAQLRFNSQLVEIQAAIQQAKTA